MITLISVIIAIVFIATLVKHFFYSEQFIEAKGKSVLITGCDSGIGLETAVFLDKLGFSVFAGCLQPDGDGAKSLQSKVSSKLVVVKLDITNQESIRNAKIKVEEALGNQGLWCLINNAGICIGGEVTWLTDDQCNQQIDVNFRGNIKMTQSFLPLLRKVKGRIINISSVNGRSAYPGLAVYCATKFALEGFSSGLRMELKRVGVKVIVIAPGDYAKITNIMKAQHQHALSQWESMSSEMRNIDGSYFWKVQQHISRDVGLLSPTSFTNSPLLSAMRSSVMSVQPKCHYTCATTSYNLFLKFLQILPVEMSDWIMISLRDYILNRDNNISNDEPHVHKNC